MWLGVFSHPSDDLMKNLTQSFATAFFDTGPRNATKRGRRDDDDDNDDETKTKKKKESLKRAEVRIALFDADERLKSLISSDANDPNPDGGGDARAAQLLDALDHWRYAKLPTLLMNTVVAQLLSQSDADAIRNDLSARLAQSRTHEFEAFFSRFPSYPVREFREEFRAALLLLVLARFKRTEAIDAALTNYAANTETGYATLIVALSAQTEPFQYFAAANFSAEARVVLLSHLDEDSRDAMCRADIENMLPFCWLWRNRIDELRFLREFGARDPTLAKKKLNAIMRMKLPMFGAGDLEDSERGWAMFYRAALHAKSLVPKAINHQRSGLEATFSARHFSVYAYNSMLTMPTSQNIFRRDPSEEPRNFRTARLLLWLLWREEGPDARMVARNLVTEAMASPGAFVAEDFVNADGTMFDGKTMAAYFAPEIGTNYQGVLVGENTGKFSVAFVELLYRFNATNIDTWIEFCALPSPFQFDVEGTQKRTVVAFQLLRGKDITPETRTQLQDFLGDVVDQIDDSERLTTTIVKLIRKDARLEIWRAAVTRLLQANVIRTNVKQFIILGAVLNAPDVPPDLLAAIRARLTNTIFVIFSQSPYIAAARFDMHFEIDRKAGDFWASVLHHLSEDNLSTVSDLNNLYRIFDRFPLTFSSLFENAASEVKRKIVARLGYVPLRTTYGFGTAPVPTLFAH